MQFAVYDAPVASRHFGGYPPISWEKGGAGQAVNRRGQDRELSLPTRRAGNQGVERPAMPEPWHPIQSASTLCSSQSVRSARPVQ